MKKRVLGEELQIVETGADATVLAEAVVVVEGGRVRQLSTLESHLLSDLVVMGIDEKLKEIRQRYAKLGISLVPAFAITQDQRSVI